MLGKPEIVQSPAAVVASVEAADDSDVRHAC